MAARWKVTIARWALLWTGGLIGTGLAVAYVCCFSDHKNVPRGSFKEMAIVLQGTIIFIISIYNTGYYGCRFLGLAEMAAEIRRNQKWHNIALNCSLLLLYLLIFTFK